MQAFPKGDTGMTTADRFTAGRCFVALSSLFVLLAGLLLPSDLRAEEVRVRNAVELREALARPTVDVIILADGQYGELNAPEGFGRPLTLRAERRHGAVFDAIQLEKVRGVFFQDLALKGSLSIRGPSAYITIRGLRIKGTLYLRDIDRATIHDNEVSGGKFGVILNSIRNFSVTHNTISKATEDLLRITGNSAFGTVEYNIIFDTVAVRPTHPDLIQFFGLEGSTPNNIIIRRNLLSDPDIKDHVTAQGIFVSDPRSKSGFRNILIEENLIRTRSTNTIYINGGQQNVIVRRNTLMPSSGDGGAILRLVGKAGLGNTGTLVEGNVAKILLDETKQSRIGRNFLYGRDAPLAQMFSGPSGGARWEDFLPVLGSELDRSGMGARAFLDELQAERGKPPGQRRVYLGPSWALK